MKQLVTWSMAWGLIKLALIISIPFLALYLLMEYFKKLSKSIVELFAEKRVKFSNNVIDNIKSTDNMTGRKFEIWLKKLLIKSGYTVELTQCSRDKGADLIVVNSKGARIAIQAKKLKTGRVDPNACGQAWRGMKYYNCDYAVVATNQYFSKQTKEEAKKNKTILWDRDKLMEMLEKQNKKDKEINSGKIKQQNTTNG